MTDRICETCGGSVDVEVRERAPHDCFAIFSCRRCGYALTGYGKDCLTSMREASRKLDWWNKAMAIRQA